ncbi:MAG: hypothetical protein ABW215_20380 [Kibdelosporangium sp.]
MTDQQPQPRRRWRDPGTRRTFFLGLTAAWGIAVMIAVAASSLLHFVEVQRACGRTIGGRSGQARADVVFDGVRVLISCQSSTGTTEVPMNAPAAGLLVAALGLALAAVFGISYLVLRRR